MDRHNDWEIDEIVLVAPFIVMALVAVLFRRAHDLRAEISRREVAEQRATTLARHDPLTGLPNRRVLGEVLDAELLAEVGSRNACAVFLIDLDRFKPVNDAHGHSVGDAVLIEVARRITEAVGKHGTVARMGGDEFACVIACEASSDLPRKLAGQVVRSLGQPMDIAGTVVQIGAAVGIARAPQDADTAGALLHAADLAMYETKRNGGGAHRFFDAEMDLQLRERAALEVELRQAINKGEIVPHFQPILDLVDERIIGFEALARWLHPTKGLVTPDKFIPIAEDLGIIDQLTYGMLRASCIAARAWPPELSLSVNVSPSQLKDQWLAPRVLAILTETGIAPGRLIVEVTENAVIDDMMKARELFASLQNAGVRIALDDFGKGYSSLYHLRELHFDHLKIDQSFIHSMDAPESAKIVNAMAGLGKSLGMQVTAEGVETLAEAEALRTLGCENAQGFLFGAPLDANGTIALLKSQGQDQTRITQHAKRQTAA